MSRRERKRGNDGGEGRGKEKLGSVKTVDRYRVHNTHNIIRILTYEREQECMYLRIWVVECK